MATGPLFTGSIVALVTPMLEDGTLDWDTLAQLVEWHISSQTDGIVAAGTTGESPTLDMAEHQRFIATTVKLVAGRIPVIAGTGSNNTIEAVELTRQACIDGADACLSVVPYYNKPPQEGLARHFEAVANAASKPIILYNVPSRTVADLDNDTVVSLAEHPRITGLKDASGDLGRLDDLRNRITEDFSFLSGDDSSACAYVKAGGHGVISVTANIAPQMTHNMITAAAAGDATTADTINTQLEAFNTVQGIQANPIPVKWALARSGRISPGIRLPLVPLAAAHQETVTAASSQLH